MTKPARRSTSLPTQAQFIAGRVSAERYYRSIALVALLKPPAELLARPEILNDLLAGRHSLPSVPMKSWKKALQDLDRRLLALAFRQHKAEYKPVSAIAVLKQVVADEILRSLQCNP